MKNASASVLLDYATPAGRQQTSISAERVSNVYLDLRFAGHKPIEVIGIYDYAAGATAVDNTDAAVHAALQQWCADQDTDELEGRVAAYDDEDDRDEVRAQWAAAPERAWLFTYLANNS